MTPLTRRLARTRALARSRVVGGGLVGIDGRDEGDGAGRGIDRREQRPVVGCLRVAHPEPRRQGLGSGRTELAGARREGGERGIQRVRRRGDRDLEPAVGRAQRELGIAEEGMLRRPARRERHGDGAVRGRDRRIDRRDRARQSGRDRRNGEKRADGKHPDARGDQRPRPRTRVAAVGTPASAATRRAAGPDAVHAATIRRARVPQGFSVELVRALRVYEREVKSG